MAVNESKGSSRAQGAALRLCALACAGVLTAGLLHAGEAAPPVEPATEPEKKPQPVEEAYRFERGERRDPFTFAKPFAGAQSINPNNPDDPNPIQINPAEIQAKKAEAEAHYLAAEDEMLESRAIESVQRCDKGLEVFKDIPNIASYKELQEVRERLFRLRKAADRIRQRQEAERDFSALAIRVTGVVAREKHSHAIVNARVVTKGELVPTSQDGPDVVVDEIMPQQVVFLFRGFKMMLSVSESSR